MRLQQLKGKSRQPRQWKKIFTNYTSNRDLVSRMSKEKK